MESGYRRRGAWVVVFVTVLLAAFVGYFAYNAGVANGIATTQISGGGAAGGAPALPPYPYYWYRPWGFGFFGPFLFLLFWLFVLRALVWGGAWRRHCYYGRGYYGFPPTFDEWHRRAHERMTKEPAPPPTDDDRSRR